MSEKKLGVAKKDSMTHYLAIGFSEYFGPTLREMGKNIPNQETVGLMFDAYVGGMLNGVELPDEKRAAALKELKRYKDDMQAMKSRLSGQI